MRRGAVRTLSRAKRTARSVDEGDDAVAHRSAAGGIGRLLLTGLQHGLLAPHAHRLREVEQYQHQQVVHREGAEQEADVRNEVSEMFWPSDGW
jgi:hypothetical protein